MARGAVGLLSISFRALALKDEVGSDASGPDSRMKTYTQREMLNAAVFFILLGMLIGSVLP